jgi:hypothetical protein
MRCAETLLRRTCVPIPAFPTIGVLAMATKTIRPATARKEETPKRYRAARVVAPIGENTVELRIKESLSQRGIDAQIQTG